MGLSDVTQILLERAMLGAAERHKLLANNVANASTPGYRRTDLDFHAALQGALDETAPSVEAIASVVLEPERDPEAVASADGNSVDIDREMAVMAGNALDYEALAAVAKARIKMIEVAAGVRT